jgi:chromosome segregation ATPase
MSEENTGAATEENTGVETTEEQPKTVEEQLAESQAREAEAELKYLNLQKTQQGSDKANTELQKKIEAKEAEIKKLVTEHMDEAAKLKYEADKRAQDLLDKDKEYSEKDNDLKEKSRALLVTEFMLDNGIDKRLRKYLTADTTEGLAEQVKDFQSIIDETVTEKHKASITQLPPGNGEAGALGTDNKGKLGKTVLESLENIS